MKYNPKAPRKKRSEIKVLKSVRIKKKFLDRIIAEHGSLQTWADSTVRAMYDHEKKV